MRIVLLSRNAQLYTTRRFIEAARGLGHESVVIDPLHCVLKVHDRPLISHRGKSLSDVGIVLPRIGNSITEFGLAVVQQFELAGVVVVNTAQAIATSRDKLRGLQMLMKHGVPVPKTVMLLSADDIAPAVEFLGGLPVIVKMRQGTQGVGVMLIENMGSLESLVATLWGLGQNLLLQRYVKECAGKDLRVVVVGDRVVGAMSRQARPGDFRANIHRGGEGTLVSIDAETERIAIAASAAMGLQVAGVDLLVSESGPQVLEVNSSPGFEALERTTGVDIARLILEHAFSMAAHSPASQSPGVSS
jgi:ribosomal protein S6--L-glutamate ligase